MSVYEWCKHSRRLLKVVDSAKSEQLDMYRNDTKNHTNILRLLPIVMQIDGIAHDGIGRIGKQSKNGLFWYPRNEMESVLIGKIMEDRKEVTIMATNPDLVEIRVRDALEKFDIYINEEVELAVQKVVLRTAFSASTWRSTKIKQLKTKSTMYECVTASPSVAHALLDGNIRQLAQHFNRCIEMHQSSSSQMLQKGRPRLKRRTSDRDDSMLQSSQLKKIKEEPKKMRSSSTNTMPGKPKPDIPSLPSSLASSIAPSINSSSDNLFDNSNSNNSSITAGFGIPWVKKGQQMTENLLNRARRTLQMHNISSSTTSSLSGDIDMSTEDKTARRQRFMHNVAMFNKKQIKKTVYEREGVLPVYKSDEENGEMTVDPFEVSEADMVVNDDSVVLSTGSQTVSRSMSHSSTQTINKQCKPMGQFVIDHIEKKKEINEVFPMVVQGMREIKQIYKWRQSTCQDEEEVERIGQKYNMSERDKKCLMKISQKKKLKKFEIEELEKTVLAAAVCTDHKIEGIYDENDEYAMKVNNVKQAMRDLTEMQDQFGDDEKGRIDQMWKMRVKQILSQFLDDAQVHRGAMIKAIKGMNDCQNPEQMLMAKWGGSLFSYDEIDNFVNKLCSQCAETKCIKHRVGMCRECKTVGTVSITEYHDE